MKFMADFETSTPEWLDIDDCARVWACAWVDIDSVYLPHYGNSLQISNQLEEFIQFFKSLTGEHVCYFHNLKFDGQYILDYLLRHGYASDPILSKPNTFYLMETDMGIWYQLKVRFEDTPELTPKGNQKMRKGKPVMKKTVISFRDSLKKIPLKVSQIAKAYGIEEQKTSCDYRLYRPLGHQLTDKERIYVSNDVIIVAKALYQMINEQQMTSLTMSSDALKDFKTRFACANNREAKGHQQIEDVFRRRFPELPPEVDEAIRKAYRGGYTYCQPTFASQVIHDGIVYDVNSLYPSRMRDCPLPYGKPVYQEGQLKESSKYPLFTQTILTRFRLRKDHLPTIQVKNSLRFNQAEYLTTSVNNRGEDEVITLTLTNIDLKLFYEHYQVLYIEYIDGYLFKAKKGMFNCYIDYWGEVKKNSVGGQRQLAKLMLNSLYGKFGTNTHNVRKEPFLDEFGNVKYQTIEEDPRSPVYIPVACFTTAWARDLMIRSAQACYDRFLYCDTDSLHIVGLETPNIPIDNKELGYWKCEGVFATGKYLRAKTYCEQFYINEHQQVITDPKALNHEHTTLSNVIDVKCAGMPEDCKKEIDCFDDFYIGAQWEHGKLGMKTVKGGCILYETTFKIKE